MALIFLDSFDHYTDLTDKWTQYWARNAFDTDTPAIGAYGRFGTNGIRIQSNGTSYGGSKAIQITLNPGSSTFIVGLAFKPVGTFHWNGQAVPAIARDNINESSTIVQLWTADGATRQCALSCDWAGHLVVNVGGDATWNSGWTRVATSTLALQEDNWYYLEWKGTINASTGSTIVRVDGVEWINATGLDLQGHASDDTWGVFQLGSLASSLGASGDEAPQSGYWDIDDVVVMDDTGSYANDFFGDITIGILRPNDDTATVEWTRSDPAVEHWTLVDETPPDGDTTYVQTSTLNAIDLYEFENVPAGSDILGIQVNIYGKKTDLGTSQIAPVLDLASVQDIGTTVGLNVAYGYVRQPYSQDPINVTGWTESTVNALRAGVKKIA